MIGCRYRSIGMVALALLVVATSAGTARATCERNINGLLINCTPFTTAFSEPPDSQQVTLTNPSLDPGFFAAAVTAHEVGIHFTAKPLNPAQTFTLEWADSARVGMPHPARFGVVTLSAAPMKGAGIAVQATRPAGGAGAVRVGIYSHGRLVREGAFPSGGHVASLATLPGGFRVKAVKTSAVSYTWILQPPQSVSIGGLHGAVGTGDELRILIPGASEAHAARNACEFVAHSTDTLIISPVAAAPLRKPRAMKVEMKH